MRTSHTARLASAIAIAFAGHAYAATAVSTSSVGTRAAATSSSGTAFTGTNSNLMRSSTAVPAPSNTASTGTSNTTTNNSGTNTNTSTSTTSGTNVDVRNQQTQQAVAGTHASGSTSALGPLATGNASVNSPTTAGTGTTAGTATTSAAGTVPFIVTPIYSNPSDVTAGIATIPAANGSFMANGIASNDVYAGAVTAPDVTLAANAANGASVDRAINQVSRDRKRVGRNGQLLYSIAPRSNGVDRSREMPDDAASPALTGSNSTLAR